MVSRVTKRLFSRTHGTQVWAANPRGVRVQGKTEKVARWLFNAKEQERTHAWRLTIGDQVVWDVTENDNFKHLMEAGALLVREL